MSNQALNTLLSSIELNYSFFEANNDSQNRIYKKYDVIYLNSDRYNINRIYKYTSKFIVLKVNDDMSGIPKDKLLPIYLIRINSRITKLLTSIDIIKFGLLSTNEYDNEKKNKLICYIYFKNFPKELFKPNVKYINKVYERIDKSNKDNKSKNRFYRLLDNVPLDLDNSKLLQKANINFNYPHLIYRRIKRLIPKQNRIRKDIKVKFTIICIIRNIDEIWINKTIRSIKNQTYNNFETIIINNASNKTYVKSFLSSLNDERIKVFSFDEEMPFFTIINFAINNSTGDYITLIDEGDEISKNCFDMVYKNISENPDKVFFYSDEDVLSLANKASEIVIKPNYIDDILLKEYPYVSHLFCFKKSSYIFFEDEGDAYRVNNINSLVNLFTNHYSDYGKIDSILYHFRKSQKYNKPSIFDLKDVDYNSASIIKDVDIRESIEDVQTEYVIINRAGTLLPKESIILLLYYANENRLSIGPVKHSRNNITKYLTYFSIDNRVLSIEKNNSFLLNNSHKVKLFTFDNLCISTSLLRNILYEHQFSDEYTSSIFKELDISMQLSNTIDYVYVPDAVANTNTQIHTLKNINRKDYITFLEKWNMF